MSCDVASCEFAERRPLTPALSPRTGRGSVPLALAIVLALIGGCRSETKSLGRADNPLSASSTQPARIDPNVATQSDPCAARMHDVAGAMLMYYALNQRLPERLEELSAMQDVGAPTLEFICPQSSMPYVYVPSGLRAEGKSKVIILHDAAAVHAGASRWCILMPDVVLGTPTSRSMEVLQLPESVFRLYR